MCLALSDTRNTALSYRRSQRQLAKHLMSHKDLPRLSQHERRPSLSLAGRHTNDSEPVSQIPARLELASSQNFFTVRPSQVSRSARKCSILFPVIHLGTHLS